MKLTYREDIDGLRAISVLAVVFNHAGIALFPGGYIGVDIFFVISGYLITSIILREILTADFSIIRFYERRLRRILPALFITIAFTLAVSAIMYDAEKFKEFGKSVIATTLFASNINFWRESGYFEAPSQLKPLLHTWSLAVEEQFYIFFPLLMFLLYRYARKIAPTLLFGITILSLAFAIVTVSKDPSAAFYLAHLRAWELLVGAFLALNIIPENAGKKYSDSISILGFVLVLVPVFLYTSNTKFPGLSALPPVLGAAFIIFSGANNKTLIGKFLSLPPLVFIGKISYSLYLWHWPLIIFAKYYMIRKITPVEVGLLLAVTLVISTLSWRFVETPFRSKSFISTRYVYLFAVSGMACTLLIGGTIYRYKGFPKRQGLEYLQQDNQKKEVWLYEECSINATDDLKEIKPCSLGDEHLIPSFMVWGDSHAPTYGKAIHTSAFQHGVSGVLTYGPGCPILLNMARNQQTGDITCVDYNKMVINYLEEHPEIKTVILAGRWTIWLEGTLYKQEEGITPHLIDTMHDLPDSATSEQLFILGLKRTIETLQAMGLNVVIIAPLPEIGYDVPSANFIASRTGRDINQIIAPTLDEYLIRNQKMFAILNTFEKKYKIQVIEPWKSLCQKNICRVAINEIPLYNDDDHLSVFGSELITPIFDPLFESIKN